jgi:putative SOS response-associated peptidase YedK
VVAIRYERNSSRSPRPSICSTFPSYGRGTTDVAPTQQALAIRAAEGIGNREPVLLRWGLIPSWAKDMKIGANMINARAETVATKPGYRQAFAKRRCLIVADGFYEWQTPAAVRRRQIVGSCQTAR